MPDDDDAQAERVYRWTIRALYALAIGLNVWLLWEQVKDSPETQIWQRTWRARAERALEPLRERVHFRRHLNAVIYEATEIVENPEPAA